MRLTASKVGLAKACGYWLTPTVELPPRTSTEASAEGDRVHKLVEEDDGRAADEDHGQGEGELLALGEVAVDNDADLMRCCCYLLMLFCRRLVFVC